MTEEQFNFAPVIDDIAKNLFTSEAVGGRIDEGNTWETVRQLEVLFQVANSNTLVDL